MFLPLILIFQIISFGKSTFSQLLYFSHDLCDDSLFYQPYVKIFATRHHQYVGYLPNALLDKTGFLDLRRFSGIVCINGPAFLYTELIYIYDASNTAITSLVFGGAKVKTYTHECFSFNRMTREVYKTGATTDAQGNPWIMNETSVFGNKFYGIYLLGGEGDYRQSDFVIFNEPNYGYAPYRQILDGVSVAMISNKVETAALCFHAEDSEEFHWDGIIWTNYFNKPVFCHRSDDNSEFDTVWHQNVMSNQVKWEQCDGSETFPAFEDVSRDELYDTQDITLDDTNFLTNSEQPRGTLWDRIVGGQNEQNLASPSRPEEHKRLEEHIWDFKPSSVEWSDRDLSQTKNVTNASKPPKEYRFYRQAFTENDCQTLPEFSDFRGKCQTTGKNPCALLNHILTIETVNWNVGKLKGGNWRKSLLLLVESIYTKVCPQVGAMFGAAVTRIFEYYFAQSMAKMTEESQIKFQSEAADDEQRWIEWMNLRVDLEECNKHAKMLPFTRVDDSDKSKKVQYLESKLEKLAGFKNPTQYENSKGTEEFDKYSQIVQLQDSLNALDRQHLYKIELNNRPIQNQAYVEAAEIDYNLDWGIDSFWKIISTVMGYCYVHFEIVDPATFLNVYDFFADHFLEYVKEDWMDGEPLDVYDQILGQYVHGIGSVWIDACNNGVYQWTNISHLRPLRPLHLPHEENDHEADYYTDFNDTKTPNFFVVNPVFPRILNASMFNV